MTKILLKNNLATQSHLLVITNAFKNEFGLPDKVNDYIVNALKEPGKTTLTYNYIGKYISVFVPDKKMPAPQLHEALRRHGATVADGINAHKGSELYIYNQTANAPLSLFAAEGMALGNYQFGRHRTEKVKGVNTLKTIFIANSKLKNGQVTELGILCEATCRARDLVNEPVNILNAQALAKAFEHMGKEAGFDVQVLNRKKIKELKMGGLLAVNAGSVDEPTFTIMQYKPRGAKNKKPLVLVGKGVVYDTGGLSLKPTANSMDYMKCDMAGAAAVGCAMYAIAAAKLKVHVVALVPATDNRPGYNAFAPGDIITMMNGSTVEMLNSDAEGRMILADALHYAKQFDPDLLIDIATLTGSASAAIGPQGMVGMGTANKKQRDVLQHCGLQVHERIAEFPFWDDYDDLLKSEVADLKNIGGPVAGAITAGKFLAKFTDYPFYHLDMVAPAFLHSKDSYRGKGGTGVGVRLFFEFAKRY